MLKVGFLAPTRTLNILQEALFLPLFCILGVIRPYMSSFRHGYRNLKAGKKKILINNKFGVEINFKLNR